MMNIPESLPRRLLEQLKSDGLKDAFFLPDRSLLLRAAAAIPYVNAQKGGEAIARTVDVKVSEKDGKWTFHLEHPNAVEVMHPNWDGDGCWRLSRAETFVYTGEQSLVDLIRCMLGSLQMKTGCYTLQEPVNRNAVSWCYMNGKVPIKVIRVHSDRAPGRNPSPPGINPSRAPETGRVHVISVEAFEE